MVHDIGITPAGGLIQKRVEKYKRLYIQQLLNNWYEDPVPEVLPREHNHWSCFSILDSLIIVSPILSVLCSRVTRTKYLCYVSSFISGQYNYSAVGTFHKLQLQAQRPLRNQIPELTLLLSMHGLAFETNLFAHFPEAIIYSLPDAFHFTGTSLLFSCSIFTSILRDVLY